jgi:leucyl/phenylalanyl-tRNA---protein transferase
MLIEPRVLLDLYRNGRFPMADDRDGAIYIYDPDPRGIIELERFHIPDTLRRTIRSGRFDVRWNTAFAHVIHACAQREETWISSDIEEAYIALHRLGFAHSVEAWHEDALAGGLYGVAMGGVFFGESMFTRVRDASKVALAALVERMRASGMTLLDTQFVTPHLRQFGATEIPREEYKRRLRHALAQSVTFVP